jgi:Flp pilus assembly pilin Flp
MFQHCFARAARLVRREGGLTAVDYAVLLALVVLAGLVAITALGSGGTFNHVAPAAAASS